MKTDNETLKRRGHPTAQMRFRYQTYLIEGDYPLESEWTQFKSDAIRFAAKDLIREFNKTGTDTIITKVYNEMNRKQPPIVITLEMANNLINLGHF